MKKFLLFIIVAVVGFTAHSQTTVEVGGSLSVTPYYDPQFINIAVGETVTWDFVLGTHNVTSTSGPEAFASDDIDSPGTFEFTFDIAGTYFYECSLFDHADTQFGTITVTAPSTIENADEGIAIAIFPNPANDQLRIEVGNANSIEKVQVFSTQGQLIKEEAVDQKQVSIITEELALGMYIFQIHTNEGVITERIQIQK